MGINMGRMALLRKKNSQLFPEYSFDTQRQLCSRSYMMQKLHEFNHEIREIRKYLTEEVMENPIIDRSIDSIYNRFGVAVDKTSQAVNYLKQTTSVAIETTIKQIADIFGVQKDPIEDKYSLFERGKIISETSGYTIPFCNDLLITPELLDSKFPDIGILSNSELYNTMNLLCNSQSSSDIESNSVKAEQLISELQDIKDRMLDETFRNYSLYSESILGSSLIMANKVFGQINIVDENVPLTANLYSTACDNIVKLKDVKANLDILLTDYTREYNIIDIQFQTILKNIDGIFGKNNSILTKREDKYSSIKNAVANALENGLNAISALLTVNFALLIYKLNRLISIAQNSQKIRNIGNYAIKKSLGLEESCQDYKCNGSVFNGIDALGKLADAQETVSTSSIVLNEVFESNEMNLYGLLLEADNPNKVTILDWIKTIWANISKMFDKFDQMAISEMDKTFWTNNLPKIKNTDIKGVEISDWTPYPVDIFKETGTTIKKADITNFIKKEVDKITTEDDANNIHQSLIDNIFPNFLKALSEDDKKKSFADRITKIFKGGEIITTNVKLGDQKTNFDPQKLSDFIDDYLKGMVKKYTNAVKDHINAENKKIDTSYPEWKKLAEPQQEDQNQQQKETDQTPNSQAAQNQEPPTNTADKSNSTQTNNSPKEQGAGSFLYPAGEIFEQFNLATVLGIKAVNELQITNAKAVAGDLAWSNNGRSTQYTKNIDNVIKTYIGDLSTIMSAMMNHSAAAYRQYSQLYRMLYQEANKPENAQTT